MVGGNVVAHCRIVRLAEQIHRKLRDEERASRLAAVERDRVLTAQDARIFRCPGCGDWQYAGSNTRSHNPRGPAFCQTCGTRVRA